jgi:hypothetical protein
LPLFLFAFMDDSKIYIVKWHYVWAKPLNPQLVCR